MTETRLLLPWLALLATQSPPPPLSHMLPSHTSLYTIVHTRFPGHTVEFPHKLIYISMDIYPKIFSSLSHVHTPEVYF